MAEGTSNKYKGYVHAGKGVYYDEKQRMRERYPVFKGVMEAVEEDIKVAVKVIDASAESQQEAKKFLDLDHHNIVRCFTSGEFQPRGLPSIFIAMELCEPDTIFERVMKGYCTSSELKNKILFHMACGLDYLHSQPILHRDLKPQNVLFKDGDYKLAGFGFSKKNSDRWGTDGWRAPETYDPQPRNSRISEEADIFSLGLIYYFVLSQGKHAFGDNEDLWNDNIKTVKGMDLSGLKCNDVALNRHLIESMLEKEPKDRPSIMDILLHPIFWNEGKNNMFFQKATGYIMQTENGLVEKLNENTFDVLNGKENWSDDLLLEAEEITRVEKKLNSVNADEIKQHALNEEHGTASVDSLLRFMNLCNSQGDSQRVAIILQQLGGSWKFFSSRFPNLFCQVYYTIKDHVEEDQCKDSGILSYFSKGQKGQQESESRAGDEPQETHTSVAELLLKSSKVDTDTIPADQHLVQNADEAMYQRHLNDPDIYQMNHGQRGAAFILNNHTYGDSHMNIEGSRIDAEKMTTLWEKMGCSVQQLTNCAAKSLLEALRNFSKTVNDVDYCAIILMSHGTSRDGADVIICNDNEQVEIASILDFFNNANCPQLQGIPKLFFIQSCRDGMFDRGNVRDTDGMPVGLSEDPDILVSFSIQPNYVGYRNKGSGTWFINLIFKIFSILAHDTDVLFMMTEVIRLIDSKIARTDYQGKQMSELKSTLSKKLYLFPGIPKQK